VKEKLYVFAQLNICDNVFGGNKSHLENCDISEEISLARFYEKI
jgi:hypothetical protein